MSRTKVALGRRLFFDPRLSVTGRYSCGSCHQPGHAYTDRRRVAVGATGQALPHRTMSLVNAAYEIAYGWTQPGAPSLERQMLTPMLNEHPVELGLKGRRGELLDALSRDERYRRAFRAAFPSVRQPITFADVVKAIAAFERTLIFGDSPFDRYVFDDDLDALSTDAKAGMALFFSKRLGCAGCHSGIDFDGNWRDRQGRTGPPSFANDGISREPVRVPTLRDVALKAPYMHDGRYATLGEVLDHYVRVGREPDSGHGGTRDPRLRTFSLSRSERLELIAFLESLTDPELASLASRGAR
jgi:cytochrome c peroxidase